MTFRQFNPSSDTLEVGTKIRLAGREGEIIGEEYGEVSKVYHMIKWDNEEIDCWSMHAYTFEIADKPVKPLTIDKRVKEGVMKAYHQWADDSEERLDNVIAYLNSLEET